MQNLEITYGKKTLFKTKFLWFLMLAYSMAYVTSNLFDPRLIRIFGLDTGGGIIVFPLTFLLSDLITEVYGYKHARQAIWCGFLFNVSLMFYGYSVSHLFNSSNTPSSHFDKILSFDLRIVTASAISYFFSESLNSFVIAKLKIKMAGKYMGIRFLLSTILASSIDTTLFCLLGFYRTMADKNLLSFVLSSFLIKVSIETIGLPISVRLAKKLKKLENLDIYDKDTQFNILSLNTDYTTKDNEFKQKSDETL